jgi:hypothetical protein
MTRLVIAGAVLAVLASGAAHAGDSSWNQRAAGAFGGDVGFDYGGGPDNWNGTPYTNAIYGGAFRANLFVDPKWSVQFDFNAEHYHLTKTDYANWNLATHISTRSDTHLFGGFASIGYNGDYLNTAVTAGLEGLMFLNNVHLYGQVGWTGTIDAGSGWPTDTSYAHGEVRYFLTPNLMLAGNAGIARTTMTGYSATVYRWGGDVEIRLADTPWSGFLSYQGSSEHWNVVEAHEVHSFMAGLKMKFGAQDTTLQAASRSGATLRDLNMWTGVNAVRQLY